MAGGLGNVLQGHAGVVAKLPTTQGLHIVFDLLGGVESFLSDLAGRFFLDPAFEADDGFVANGPSHVSGKEKRKLIVEGKEREIGSIFPAPNKRLVAIRRWFYPGEGPEVIIIINDKGDVVARVDIPEK